MRVGNQGANCLSSCEEPGKNLPVTFGGQNQRGDRDGQPTVNDGLGLCDLERTAHRTRIRRDSEKRQKRGPTERDWSGASQGFLEPAPRSVMLSGCLVVGVEQDVGVEEIHLWSGPSISSRRLLILSMLTPGSSPMSNGCTRNGVVALAAFFRLSPARRQAFTVSLNGRPVLRASECSLTATSSSSVRV